MDSSKTNAIQPSRGDANRSAAPPVFSGTVTGVKRENGVQTVEVQYSQGKLQFAADGDFQAGEKIRLSFPGGNSIQVAKDAASGLKDDEGVGYTLPQNLGSLRTFEKNVTEWLENTGGAAGQSNGSGANGTTAAGNTGGMAGGSVFTGTASSMPVSLPELMMQIMERDGGQDFLAKSMAGLDRNLVGAMMDAVEQMPGDPAIKAALMDMLKLRAKTLDAAGGDASKQLASGASGNGALENLDGFWPAEAGDGATPWFGRIVEKDSADSFLSPMNRLQYGGAGGPPKTDPAFRYMLDVGGRNMEVYSSQSMDKGSLADFELEAHGGRMQAKFLDPSASLPSELRADFANASPSLRQSMQLSSRYLEEFKDQPYFGKLVKDFSEVLDQSGRMDDASAKGSTGSASTAGGASPEGLPTKKELDNLLRLFVAFPRDAKQPEKQARVWGDAIRNPQAMMDLLKTLRPDEETPLLRQGTGLRLAGAAGLPASLAAAEAGEHAASETSPEAMAGWLKKLLPENFKSADLLKLAEDNSPFTAAARDPDPSKFLLQAVVNSFPKDDEMRQGKPAQFYFYQGQEWRGLQVTWEKGHKDDTMGRGAPKAPLQVRVETDARNMGKVKVGVTWDPKGARIDFKNQFHDVRELLSQSLPELEKSLNYMDFKVASFTYELLPEEAASPSASQGGWIRPPGLSDGANLDLFG